MAKHEIEDVNAMDSAGVPEDAEWGPAEDEYVCPNCGQPMEILSDGVFYYGERCTDCGIQYIDDGLD